ncbi:MAG TPA: LytTR family DNA-binding domain-containing protein [Chitinophagaceae bacterium]|nr:LytTR family DNA-binding domain-containing protein [Chitinophagaceae bacterium]
MNCLIVDDNKIARSTLHQLAKHVKDLEIAGEYASAADAYECLLHKKVDLLLLDIQMPGMNGLELTKNLGKEGPLIIFTTSARDHAVEAFELNVVDYILKPVMPARFIQAIDKAREILASRNTEVKSDEDEFIFIRDSSVIRRLKIDDILYAEAMGDYVKLHTRQKFYAIHTTLKAVEARLPSSKFLRIHRSYIIAISKIDTLQDGSVVINGKSLPVADAYRYVLNSRMNVI